MATDTYVTYDLVGMAEDVDDVISNISPKDTPFVSMIGKDTCDATHFEWQEDTLRAPASNALVEGADAVVVARVPTSMRGNRTQIMGDTFSISGTSDRVKKYGRKSETAYQTAKMGLQLRRDLEYILVALDQDAAAGDEDTARYMGNVFGVDANGDEIIETDAIDYGATPGTAEEFTETRFLAAMQMAYDNGASPTTLMIKPIHALNVAAFAVASGRTRDIGQSKKIVNAVDLLVTPWGEVRVTLNRWLRGYSAGVQVGEALLIDPEMWKRVVLRPWQKEKLAKTGDSEKYQMLGEFSLKHRNYLGDVRITDLDETLS